MAKTNVVLITVDALRADHLGCLGYSRNTTPNLDELANEGALFLEAFSNGPYTRASFPSILSSTYPLMYGGPERLSEQRPIISKVLKENGYTTAAFSANAYLSTFFNYNMGFDKFEDFLGGSSDGGSGAQRIKMKDIAKEVVPKRIWRILKKLDRFERYQLGKPIGIRADMLNRHAISWVRNRSSFFIWLHYNDVHWPYIPYRSMRTYSKSVSVWKMFRLNDKMLFDPDFFAEDELKELIALYDDGIRYADHAIGLFFDELKKMGIWLNNTLIIVTADHGDEFKEHGQFSHPPKLYDELLHVPLIIAGPGIPEKTIAEGQVSLVDLAPTILDLLGIEEVEKFQGKSVLPLIKGTKPKERRNVISECIILNGQVVESYSYRTGEWKYILTDDGQRRKRELYDLLNDPRETVNLAEKHPEKVREFEEKINEHIELEKTTFGKEERLRPKPKPYTPEIEERLRDLGYL